MQGGQGGDQFVGGGLDGAGVEGVELFPELDGDAGDELRHGERAADEVLFRMEQDRRRYRYAYGRQRGGDLVFAADVVG
jgi:hypothetical protein